MTEEATTGVARVRAFLRRVEVDSAGRKQELATAQAAVTDLTAKLAEARAGQARAQEELERLRHRVETDLEESGARVAGLTERILSERLSAQLEGVREQVAAQYEERIRALEANRAESAHEAAAASQRVADLERELTEAERRYRARRDELEARHQDELSARAAELDELRQTYQCDVDALRAEHRAMFERQAAQHDKVVAQLEAAAAEKDALVERANQTTHTLQQETDRLRSAADKDLESVRARHRADRTELEEMVARLREERDALAARLESVEAFVADDGRLERLEELEAECAELQTAARDQEKLLVSLRQSLATVRGVCDQSPAARSIIGGSVDLERVFEPLNRG